MNLDIRDLELVREVTDCGSLTEASRRLHVTQSALSHRLQELERRLGVPLFHRHPRRMTPTLAGERIARAAAQVLGEIKIAWDEAHALGDGGVGPLRISTACYTGYAWLPEVLIPFRRRHPGVEVSIDAGSTGHAVDAVRGGTIDLALVPGPVQDDALQSAPLFRDELVALLPAEHPLAERPYLEPGHFRDQHVISYSADPQKSFFLGGILGPAGVTPSRVTGVPLTEAIVELVKAGEGVSLLARWAVESQAADGQLALRPLGEGGYHRTWHAVTLRHTPAIEAFTTLLRGVLAERGQILA